MPSRISLRLLVLCTAILVIVSLLVSRQHIPDRFLPRLRDIPGYRVFSNQSRTALDLVKTTPEAVIDETQNCDRCLTSPEWCSEFGSRNMDLSVAYEGNFTKVIIIKTNAENHKVRESVFVGQSQSQSGGNLLSLVL